MHVCRLPAVLQETEAWLQLLLELVPVVGSAQLQQHVLQLALAQGQVNEPVASRVVSCRLLGAMTAHLVSLQRKCQKRTSSLALLYRQK